MNWYPNDKNELNDVLNEFLNVKNPKIGKIHGLIVPHAGYEFSGKIAGKAFSLLKDKKINRAIILSPSHYSGFHGIKSLNEIETPLGKIKVTSNNYEKLDYEHAIDNHIPFLQKLKVKEVLPLVVGEINNKEAEKIADEISRENSLVVVSTDLSHFLSYKNAVETDKNTIDAIKNLNLEELHVGGACGFFPLMILIYLCKKKSWKLNLIEYKNSGDVTGDKSSVVGYASFWF